MKAPPSLKTFPKTTLEITNEMGRQKCARRAIGYSPMINKAPMDQTRRAS